jgi:hypothetical protein
MSNARKIKDVAKQIFELFKKRTDGRNSNVDHMPLGNIWEFWFEKKIPEETVAEAFQLLQLRNLVMPSTRSTSTGVYQLTTYGKNMDPDDLFEKTVDAAFLSQLGEIIDQDLRRECFDKSYEDAVTSAFRILEVRMRDRIKADAQSFGTDLVKEAFHPDTGKLVFGATRGEREGVYQTYMSAFLMQRNPPSHRYLKDFAGPEIVEIVMFVDLLLKILTKAEDRS